MPNKCQANSSTSIAVKSQVSSANLISPAAKWSRKPAAPPPPLLLLLLLLLLQVGNFIGAQSYSTKDSFCGHSVSELGSTSVNLHRSRRGAVELRPSAPVSLQRSSQTRLGDSNENERPQIDSTSADECGSGRRKRRQSQLGGGGGRQSPSFDDCVTSESSSSSSSQESSTNETSTEVLKTIETAVFIDQALDNRFNGLSGGLVELNKLVLTIMNQVQHLFRYSSLHVPIKIKLVLIEHLRDNERNGFGSPDTGHGDIDVYLSNFCNWQQSRLERAGARLAWDHAILLSG